MSSVSWREVKGVLHKTLCTLSACLGVCSGVTLCFHTCCYHDAKVPRAFQGLGASKTDTIEGKSDAERFHGRDLGGGHASEILTG